MSTATRLKLATFNLNNFGLEDNPDATVYGAKFDFLVSVLRQLNADVVAVNEVREPERFEELAAVLGSYPGRFLGDAPAERRHIQTGLLFRHDVTGQGQWHDFPAVLPDRPGESLRMSFSRPVPWVRLGLPDGSRLFVCAVHLKSWRAGAEELPPDATNRARQVLGRAYSIALRNSEAAGLRLRLDEVMDTGMADHYAVMGDFNDRLDSSTVDLVTGLETEEHAELARNEERRLFPAGWWLSGSRQFSYVRHGRRELFDHILVSRLLSLRLVSAGAEGHLLEPVHVRRVESGGGFPRSDHAPAWAEFTLARG